ncbi:hypothetical protein PanWU01x14_260880 [Parasponia andersonii]|uniref:Uncharacterized protein n=1 Tax=Parasponia andersonii TaxID=3476 RepID=A0A2P5B8L2_PARAD|nr:hypothetical protein PanWU01x14_260880 [Parasponia andersonii]
MKDSFPFHHRVLPTVDHKNSGTDRGRRGVLTRFPILESLMDHMDGLEYALCLIPFISAV